MPREYKNLVSDTTATTGTADFVLSGVVGFPGTQTFLAGHTDLVDVGYHVFSAGNVEFEAGKGVWNAGTSTLTRVSVETSSNGNAKVVFSAGVKTVISTPVASDMAGMVPYTGATANVDLGSYNLHTSGILAFGVDGYIEFADPLKRGYIYIDAPHKYSFEGGASEGGLDFTNMAGGDKNFVFPNQSGTVALTSNITGTNSGTNTGDQNITGLVPYTGASANVDLGFMNLQANKINGAIFMLDTDRLVIQSEVPSSGLAGVGFGTVYVGKESVAIGRYAYTTTKSTAIGFAAGGWGSSTVHIGYKAGYEEPDSHTLLIDNQHRGGSGQADRTAQARAGAMLYGEMSATPSAQKLTTNAAFTARFGMNIPAGQTYKIAGVPIGGGAISNVIAVLTTIAADTTYAVASYLKINAALTVDGNLIITG